MLSLINYVDYTNQIHPSKLKIDSSISQPMSKATMRIDDIGSTYGIRGLQEAVIIDENGLANQTVNLLLNPNFDIPASSASGLAAWSLFTTANPNLIYNTSSVNASQIIMQVAGCTNTDAAYLWQQVMSGYIVPGQAYMLSMTLQNASLSHANSYIQIQYIDSNGANVGSPLYVTYTVASGTKQVTAQMTAPAGAASAIIQFGVTITGAGAGQATFSNIQFEPISFVGRGYSYPTPLCNHLQPNCYVLPSGMTIRQTRLFTGYVTRAQKSYSGKNRRWDIECSSSMKLLDSAYITASYPAGMTDGQIIQSLLSQATYAVHPFGSGVQLITGNNVSSNIVMPFMSWDNVSVLSALQDIVAITGCIYYVDDYYDLNYFASQFNVASFGLSDTPDNVSTFAYANFIELEDASQPKSRITVTGGDYYPTWVDPFTGDGSTTSFNLTQTNPQSITTLTVAGAIKKVGINGQNTFSQGYDALLDTNANKIVFQTAPASSAAISATYIFKTPLRTRAWDLASIGRNYGIAFDAKLDDTAILDKTTALQRGIGELEGFADGRESYTLDTQVALLPGQIVPLYSTTAGISGLLLLVQSVSVQPKGGGVTTYSVGLGDYDPELPALLRAIAQKKAGTSNQTIQLLQENVTWSESQPLSFSDSYTITSKPTLHFNYGNASSTYGYAAYS